MNWQYLIVGLLISGSTAYLVRQTWRTWFGAKVGCGGGCACAGKKPDTSAQRAGPATTMISVNELTQRMRTRS